MEKINSVIEILFENAMENYKGNEVENKALAKIEELRMESVKKHGEVIAEIFDKLDKLYFNYGYACMQNFFFLGIAKGFYFNQEIEKISALC